MGTNIHANHHPETPQASPVVSIVMAGETRKKAQKKAKHIIIRFRLYKYVELYQEFLPAVREPGVIDYLRRQLTTRHYTS